MNQFRINCKKQHGLSIISMLIGLLISVLCILGSLTLYRNLVQVTTDARVDTGFNGQLASAMLTVQMEVQNAGFGLANFAAGDLVRIDGIDEVELRWRYSDGNGGFLCRGLREELVVPAGGGINQRALILTQLPAGCIANNDLTDPNADWRELATLASWPIVNKVTDYLTRRVADDRTLLDFTLARSTCSPYGATAAQEHWVVQVTAPSSAVLNLANLPLTTYSFCLLNT